MVLGAYEKTYSCDSEGYTGVVSVVFCHVSRHRVFHHHISSATPLQRLNIMDLDSYYHVSQPDSSLGWPRRSDACDSSAAAVAYWLGCTLKAEWMP